MACANHEGVSSLPDTRDPFVAQLDAHRRLLYKVAHIYGRAAADREDLSQEIVVQLWRAFPRFDPQQKFSTWMYRIALNVAISWQRRERTQTRHIVPAGEGVLEAAGAPDPVDDEDVTLLYRCIGTFDELDRALLLLYLDGHSHQDISDVLGITATNVATKIGRLKNRLRAQFRAAGHL